MEKLIDKLSEYNLITNFIPGVIYYYFVEKYTSIDIKCEDLIVSLFLCFFMGLIISRVGSILVEPVMKKWMNKKGIPFERYDEYCRAEKKDSKNKLIVLNTTNNLYRTLIVTPPACLTTWFFDIIWKEIPHNDFSKSVILSIGCLTITLIFIISYKKQTEYVKNQVRCLLDSKKK